MTGRRLDDGDLEALEERVTRSLRHGDGSGLDLLGEGEISLVLRAGPGGEWACKRLPPFPSATAAERYAATVDRYLATLRDRGVDVVATECRAVPTGDGAVLYCVQPALAPETQAVAIVRSEPDRAPGVLADVVETIFSTVDARVGLDAQLSNWAVADGRLRYFDVTTPLLRDPGGNSELDVDVFLASLPWALRPPVRRFVAPGIIARYHEPRTVALDLAANLLKEELDDLVPVVVDAANLRLEAHVEGHRDRHSGRHVGGNVGRPLDVDEVRRDRRSDARTWAALQTVRRVDRSWQRHVRRRTYPFLLPTPHARH